MSGCRHRQRRQAPTFSRQPAVLQTLAAQRPHSSPLLFLIQGFHDIVVPVAELGERVPRDVETSAYIGHRTVSFQHADNDAPVLDKHIRLGVAAFLASEYGSFGFSQSESFFRPQRNQVVLYLRYKPEGEAEHLAVDGVVERVAFLGRVQVNALFQTLAHDGHDVGQCPAQPRHFRHDQRVTAFHALEQPAELAVSPLFLAADNFRHPMIDTKISTVGETPDFVLLVSQMLFARANSQITYYHNFNVLHGSDIAPVFIE